MTIELGVLAAVMALAGSTIGVLTFFIGRNAASKQAGVEWGMLKENVEHIKTSVTKIEQMSLANSAEVKMSFSRVYDRMDERFRETDEKIKGSILEHEQRFHHGG